MISWIFVIIFLGIQTISNIVVFSGVKKILDILDNKPEEKETEAYITRTDPAFTNMNMVGQGDSVIVTPKSPQLIEWEENEELRKLNLRPTR